MAFESLTKAELEEAGRAFGIDWTKEKPTKNDMIKDLGEEGVEWKMYKQAFPDPEEEPDDTEDDFDPEAEAAAGDEADSDEDEPAAKKFAQKSRSSQPVLVKMTRANPSYEVRGYNFTKKHPYLPVSPDDADFLVGVLGGFQIATPREVEEFYS